jgi:hypothetical protein
VSAEIEGRSGGFTGRGSAPAIDTSTKPVPADEGFDWRAAWSAAVESQAKVTGLTTCAVEAYRSNWRRLAGSGTRHYWYGRPGSCSSRSLTKPANWSQFPGRLIDGRNPKAQTAGQRAPACSPHLALCQARSARSSEGQFDALALAACGMPAIALIGTSWPDWPLQGAGLQGCPDRHRRRQSRRRLHRSLAGDSLGTPISATATTKRKGLGRQADRS